MLTVFHPYSLLSTASTVMHTICLNSIHLDLYFMRNQIRIALASVTRGCSLMPTLVRQCPLIFSINHLIKLNTTKSQKPSCRVLSMAFSWILMLVYCYPLFRWQICKLLSMFQSVVTGRHQLNLIKINSKELERNHIRSCAIFKIRLHLFFLPNVNHR